MLDEKSPISLYYQLKDIIINKIKTDEWPVGMKIPTERELCEMFNISRMTVRQALKELENEGYVHRKQGKGTYVATLKYEQRLDGFYSFSEEIRKLGAIPSTNIIYFQILESNESISQILSIDQGSDVFSIKRLRLANKEPFAVETSYIPCDVAKQLTRDYVERYGLYNSFKDICGVVPDEADETFGAVLTDPEVSLYLKVKNHSAALMLERTTKSQGKVIEYCMSIIRGDMYKYKVALR
ncbi:GntR family transcriptional regulator [Ruminiclostridium sufflavum DSM 19573]|uniref:GntR family transcriptional regulator n=1 Tax=Ruminiclostridium sufflavum DSM 19573 TaxID=1121337 RepID=A0A318XS14_9FIRM|nr:GntR family transcriptional regulator [Ruminiclostridium sufflavum]PYG90397.1 GntR family transcriptional regulator [Ruminiclostridium sufflavum DSM 19573]